MNILGKTVLITGGSRGIGKEIAKSFYTEGAKLILVSENEPELIETVKELNGNSLENRAEYFVCDLSDSSKILELVSQVSQKYNAIDILVNNAGIGIYKSLSNLSLEEWNKSYAIDVTAPFILIKELLPLLKKSVEPLVINIGSLSGVKPYPNRSAYCSTKAAFRQLSLCLSEEYKDQKIKFCHITLGSTLTAFGPLSVEEKKEKETQGKKYFTPEFVGQKIVALVKNNELSKEILLDPEKLLS
jgi:short-subunit dehydrogenase